MKTVVPAATRRAMYSRAVAVQDALDRWIEYLAKLDSEQALPLEKGPLGILASNKPKVITIPYARFENLLYELRAHSAAIKKLRKPVVQQPK